ncbi:MAG: tRNA pseudouridine(38-40) synthase TruA [Thermoanaerobaculia bacterium]|nr:tRNA pseudouridine(38-40) synthase TruA [Thermoanaerobaculia bacterium]
MNPKGCRCYRLTIAYRGEGFSGWQRQPNAPTIQEELERALKELVGEEVRVLGAGRTDAGVHARGQVAVLHLSRSWPSSALVHGTNRRLPRQVRVMEAAEVAPEFHPQRDALGKEYRYRIVPGPVLPPLEAPTAIRVDPPLRWRAIRRATRALVGRHDFTAFAKTGGSHRNPRRSIFAAGWDLRAEAVVFRVVGDGFLRGMVRAMVGTLLEVGRGRREPAEIRQLLEGRPRGEAGPNVPARGLVLQGVFYREEELEEARDAVESLW